MKLICKKCGNEEYFYIKEKFSGETNLEVDASGELTDWNAGAYDEIDSHLKSVFYYCQECNSKVAKIPKDKRY